MWLRLEKGEASRQSAKFLVAKTHTRDNYRGNGDGKTWNIEKIDGCEKEAVE